MFRTLSRISVWLIWGSFSQITWKHFQLISMTTMFISKIEDNLHEDDVHVQWLREIKWLRKLCMSGYKRWKSALCVLKSMIMGGLKVIHPTLCIQSPSQKKTVAMRWIVDTTCNRSAELLPKATVLFIFVLNFLQ